MLCMTILSKKNVFSNVQYLKEIHRFVLLILKLLIKAAQLGSKLSTGLMPTINNNK